MPEFAPSSSGVSPSGSVEEKSFKVSGSSKGMVLASLPVKSSSIFMTVGSSCPSISSFKSFPLME